MELPINSPSFMHFHGAEEIGKITAKHVLLFLLPVLQLCSFQCELYMYSLRDL